MEEDDEEEEFYGDVVSETIECEHGPQHDFHSGYHCSDMRGEQLSYVWNEFVDNEVPVVWSRFLGRLLYELLTTS